MNKRKKITLILTWMLAIFVGVIELLEILSRTWDCSSFRTTAASVPIKICDNRFHADDVDLKNYLIELSQNYSQGTSPSPKELERAVIETNRESIGGANGIYCNGIAFVSDDLPTQAELYVRRHELEHVFQFTLQMEEENYESAANYAAAKEYPVGMAETVGFSVIESRNSYDSTTCYLIALWKIFKIYFLPFAAS